MSVEVGELANEIVDVDNGVVRRALIPLIKEDNGAGVVEDNGNNNGVVGDVWKRDVVGVASKYNKNRGDVLGWWRLKQGQHNS